MLRKIVYKLGQFVVNSKIEQQYKFLKKTETWSIEKLKEHQFSECKKLLEHAYNHSDYYRRAFDKHKFRPEDFKNLSDLSKVPIITKEKLRKNVCSIHIQSKKTKKYNAQSSGTTGRSISFYRDKLWDGRNRAAILRGYSWYGIKPWDRNGYFWHYYVEKRKRLKTKFLDFLQNRFRIFSYDKSHILVFVKKLKKARFLEGYSSMIYETAKIVNQLGLGGQFHLKLIKGTAEMILDKYQEEVEKAFGQKIRSEYGATEGGLIAFECPYGNMHISMESVIVEEIDHEIVITNLMSKSFPIIRYKLGDYISLVEKTDCKCGMQHYIIDEIQGRSGETVYGINNKYPSMKARYIFGELYRIHNMRFNYQIIQPEKGVLNIRIEKKLTDEERNLMESIAYKYFKDDMKIKIFDEENIKDVYKKQRSFISLVKD